MPVQEEASLEQIDTSSHPFKKLMTFGGGQHIMLQRAVSHRSEGESSNKGSTPSIYQCECTAKIPVRVLNANADNIIEHNKRCEKMQAKLGEPMLALESLLNPELGAVKEAASEVISNIEAIISHLDWKVQDGILQKRGAPEPVDYMVAM